jgi:hypothetical protein
MTNRVACRTPAKGRDGVTNIPEWKFEAVRNALRAVLSGGEVPFQGLSDRVRTQMTDDDLERLGSVGWHVTTVKPELEVRGEIERLPGSPQRLIWTGA